MYRRGQRNGKRGGPRKARGSVANSQANDNTPVPEGLVFFCRSCQQTLDFHPKTFNFTPPLDCCQKEKANVDTEKKEKMTCDVVYGTERSIKHYFKISDDVLDAKRKENEEKAARADKL